MITLHSIMTKSSIIIILQLCHCYYTMQSHYFHSYIYMHLFYCSLTFWSAKARTINCELSLHRVPEVMASQKTASVNTSCNLLVQYNLLEHWKLGQLTYTFLCVQFSQVKITLISYSSYQACCKMCFSHQIGRYTSILVQINNFPFFLRLNNTVYLIGSDDLASELPETVAQPLYWPYVHVVQTYLLSSFINLLPKINEQGHTQYNSYNCMATIHSIHTQHTHKVRGCSYKQPDADMSREELNQLSVIC